MANGNQSSLPAGFQLEQSTLPDGFEIESTAGQEIGNIETGLALGSAIPAELGSGLSFLGTLGATGGDIDAAKAVSDEVRQTLTYNPRTEEGQKNLQAIAGSDVIQTIGKALETAETTLGDLGFDLAGPIGGAIGETIPTAILEATGLITGAQVVRGAKGAAMGIEQAGAATGRALQPAIDPVKQLATKAAETTADIASQAAQKGVSIAEGVTGVTKRRSLTEALQKTAQTGELDTATAGFRLGPAGKSIKDAAEQAALKQNISEGFITSLKTASVSDKAAINKMVRITERRLKDPDFKLDNRPTDVIGDIVLKRFKSVRAANRTAGKRIDEVANNLKGQPIDIQDAVLGFDDALDGFGIQLIDDAKGGFKPDFSQSKLPPSDRGAIKEVVRQMNLQGGGVDAFSAHEMKRIIDRSITYGKKLNISSDGQRMLRDFRAGLDKALDTTYDSYNVANLEYAETITALNAFQDALPNKIDLDAPNIETAIGTDLRSLLSNITSRQQKRNALNTLDSVAKKYAGNGKLLIEGKGGSTPSIDKLIIAADELESRFGSFAPTGFQGGIERGTAKGIGLAAEAKVNPLAATAKAVAAGADKINRVTDEKALQALREILKGGNK